MPAGQASPSGALPALWQVCEETGSSLCLVGFAQLRLCIFLFLSFFF